VNAKSAHLHLENQEFIGSIKLHVFFAQRHYCRNKLLAQQHYKKKLSKKLSKKNYKKQATSVEKKKVRKISNVNFCCMPADIQ